MPTKAPLFNAPTSSRHARADQWRGTAASRGYDHDWVRLRNHKLAKQPLCEPCEAAGRVTQASLVHHVQTIEARPDLRLRLENTMSVCAACHQAAHAALNKRSTERDDVRH